MSRLQLAVLSWALLVPTSSAAETCAGDEAAIYDTLIAHHVRQIGPNAGAHTVLIHPETVTVTREEITHLVQKYEWGAEGARLPALEQLSEYKQLLKVASKRDPLPSLSSANVHLRQHPYNQLGCPVVLSDEDLFKDFPTSLEFSHVGFVGKCDKAAVFVHSQGCVYVSYHIYKLEKQKTWSVADDYTLYVEGE